MPLENATYVSQLVGANPSSTDSVAQADDHMRLIKTTLVNTFPNLNGPVTATAAQLNTLATAGAVPTGGIIMWSGSIASIPSGWALCDGTNGTPNLRDKFIIGAGTTYAPGASGGSLTSGAAGAHSHAAEAGGAHSHGGVTGGTALTIAQMPSHTHDYTYYRGPNVSSGGGAQPYALNAVTGTTTATGSGEAHTHTISTEAAHTHTINSAGEHTHTVTPPYYALCFIMKV